MVCPSRSSNNCLKMQACSNDRNNKPFKSYGRNPIQQSIMVRIQSIMVRIRVDDEKARAIEEGTQDQSQSSMWFAHRAPRITASKCKRALMIETTSPSKAMGEILYNSNYQSEHMRDGIKSEEDVIKQYFKQTGNTVQVWIFYCQVTPIFRCFSRWPYRQGWSN